MNKSITLEFATDTSEGIKQILEFINIFNHEKISEEIFVIEPLQKITVDFKNNINIFCDKYKDECKSIYRLQTFINGLNDDEYVYLFNEDVKDTILKYELQKKLISLNNRDFNLEEWNKYEKECFGEVIKNYDLFYFDGNINKKLYVGNGLKSDRICRFCSRTKIEGAKFNKIAHAISEALGNKNIILNDECDECNEYFGSKIECQLIEYLNLYRPLYDIKGKSNKSPTVKGKNYCLKREGNDVHLEVAADNYSEFETNKKVSLHSSKNITAQILYKTLVKYFLSVVNEKYLNDFKETIKWIRGGEFVTNLPKVGVVFAESKYTDKPTISLYIRKNKNIDLPLAVCEVAIKSITYCFIIPTFNKNEKQFVNKEEYYQFLEVFKHYKSHKDFMVQDFSSDKSETLKFNIIFNKTPNN
jgi:hypothetical protein